MFDYMALYLHNPEMIVWLYCTSKVYAPPNLQLEFCNIILSSPQAA
jgi:hypothetical protein